MKMIRRAYMVETPEPHELEIHFREAVSPGTSTDGAEIHGVYVSVFELEVE
jgi:hypothetical protein